MRRIVLMTMVAFIAGLFTVSQGLGADEYEQGAAEMQEGEMMQEEGAAIEEEGAGMEEGAVAAVPMDSSQVSEMQRLLQEQGYDPGATDGVMGAQTEEAIRNFQEAQGLAATGQPDEETLRALAPDAETQEMLGLSPEFGQEQMQQPMEQDQMQEPMQEMPKDGGMSGQESDTEQPSTTY